MSSVTDRLMRSGLATGALQQWPWLADAVQYETVMGSHAYGVADTSVRDRASDIDVYGFAIPPKEMVFPHCQGRVLCFGQNSGQYLTFGPAPKGFDQYQQHHIMEQDALAQGSKEWDLLIFNIVKFFQLCFDNNPNIIDSLFTPDDAVIHCTKVGRMVRENRQKFLSKKCWNRFRGFAKRQMKRLGETVVQGDRKQIVDKFSYDVKAAYHLIRLFDEVEQILTLGDLDLQRASQLLKSLRRGEWTIDAVQRWAVERERKLEIAFAQSRLPKIPPFEPLNQLLLDCLEEHYGSLNEINIARFRQGTASR